MKRRTAFLMILVAVIFWFGLAGLTTDRIGQMVGLLMLFGMAIIGIPFQGFMSLEQFGWFAIVVYGALVCMTAAGAAIGVSRTNNPLLAVCGVQCVTLLGIGLVFLRSVEAMSGMG